MSTRKFHRYLRDLLERFFARLNQISVPLQVRVYLCTQHHVEEAYHRVAGLGTRGARGPEAGLCWMDFVHLEPSAPPQIVGHSRRDEPVKNGNIVCRNIPRANQSSPGGEGVLVETPADLVAVIRQSNGGVSVSQLD